MNLKLWAEKQVKLQWALTGPTMRGFILNELGLNQGLANKGFDELPENARKKLAVDFLNSGSGEIREILKGGSR